MTEPSKRKDINAAAPTAAAPDKEPVHVRTRTNRRSEFKARAIENTARGINASAHMERHVCDAGYSPDALRERQPHSHQQISPTIGSFVPVILTATHSFRARPAGIRSFR